MKPSILIPIALCAIIPVAAHAQVYEKEGKPCIAELCIGDGLAELSKIKWDRAVAALAPVIGGKPTYVTELPLVPSQVHSIREMYRGNLKPAAHYLANRSFDSNAIEHLKGVTAACTETDLWGKFTAGTGKHTEVKIALLPSDPEDPVSQRWTVTEISQRLPAVKSDTQKADAVRQLKERYAKFGNPYGYKNGARGYFEAKYDSIGGMGFSFFLARLGPPLEFRMLDKHPACGGAQPVSID